MPDVIRLIADPVAFEAKLLEMERWAETHEMDDDRRHKLRAKQTAWALFRMVVFWEGAMHGFPAVDAGREPDGALLAWPEGWVAWRNRCRLAPASELAAALASLALRDVPAKLEQPAPKAQPWAPEPPAEPEPTEWEVGVI